MSPQAWRSAEMTWLSWDAAISVAARNLCTLSSTCYPTLQFLTETTSVKIIFILALAISVWIYARPAGPGNLLPMSRRVAFESFFFALAVGIGDFLGNQAKYLFKRLRPEFGPEAFEYTHKIPYSFPSNHALNLVTIATLWILIYGGRNSATRSISRGLIGIAVLISVSRILMGRHYPADILSGALLGFLWARLAHHFYCRITRSGRIIEKPVKR